MLGIRLFGKPKKETEYEQFKREMDKQAIKQTINKSSRILDKPAELLNPGRPTNIGMIQSRPRTILTRDQEIMNSLFNDKNQTWGNGQPVQINHALTSGGGLIKTGTGNATRRLMMP